ncbi:MAG: glycosyltransferase, partial [Victivallales bacterium]|nr:glycosyltransferase [Victivallales bacterium]
HLSLREGLPRAVVQALASGKPAICFALDGAPEVVLDGVTGYSVEAGDVSKVADLAVGLLEDRGKLKELGENGRDLVKEKFDWRRMGDILEEEYYRGLGMADD